MTEEDRLINALADYSVAIQLMMAGASPLNADNIADGIIITEAAYDALLGVYRQA